ncbi:MAG: XrtA system polysaccharide deacetylase [Nitrospirota bacterium]
MNQSTNKPNQLNQLINLSTNKQIANALTIDVEDYYMVSAFEDVIKFEDWHRYESRVERNTHKILDLLDEYQVKATFFVLGWVAEHYPNLVRDIHASGHEIACHGYNHRLIYHLTPDEFREDVRIAKSILEDTIGTQVIGYRAASYSIVKRTLWALDILIEEGFLYDSSIFPVHHDRYGLPGADRFPYAIKRNNSTIVEFPPSTYRIFNQNIPIAGGGYLRLYPLQITKAVIKRINEKEKKIAILYIHPWEIDVEQPRLNGRRISRIRHYINLKSTLPKLRYFLTEFRFGPLSSFLNGSMI